MPNAEILPAHISYSYEKPQRQPVRLMHVRAEHFILELNTLKELVAFNEQKLKTAEYQVKMLSITNKRFKQKLNRLTKLCRQASQFSYIRGN
jgi:hypothetical protein